MKILHISDTHGCHHRMRDLPEADMIVHSGDFTMNGSPHEDCASVCQKGNYAKIPVDTDILITHAPPFGILDFDGNVNYGSKELFSRIFVIKPHLHIFGHIHSGHGIKSLSGITFSNGSIMNTGYDDMLSPNLIEYII